MMAHRGHGPLMQVAVSVLIAGLIRTWLAGIMVGSLVVLLLWALSYAFVSSQNFGTAVRYRVQILPILLGLLLYLGRDRRSARLPDRLAFEHA
jgi:hypothetical protein